MTGHFLGEVVDIKVYTWLAVEVLLIVFYSLVALFSRTVFVAGLFVAGWIFALILRVLLGKLLWVRDMLLEQTLLQRAELLLHECVPSGRVARVLARWACRMWLTGLVLVACVNDRRTTDTLVGEVGHDDDELAHTVDLNDLSAPLVGAGAPAGKSKGALALAKGSVSMRMPPASQREPKYMKTNLQRPGRCARRCVGRPPNRHEALFWFGHRGVEFIEFLVRTLMLLLAVYLATVALLFYDYECADTWYQCVLFYIAALVAPATQLFLLPRVIRLFVMVTSVEKMKNRQVMDEVVRIERASKCLRALRLVSAIKAKVHEKELEEAKREGRESPRKRKAKHKGLARVLASNGSAGGSSHGSGFMNALETVSEGKSDVANEANGVGTLARKNTPMLRRASSSVYGTVGQAKYMKRRTELQEAFAMFDRDNSGEVNTEELCGVLEMLGLGAESKELSARIIREIDVDQSGSVSFEEFFEWIAEVRAACAGAVVMWSGVAVHPAHPHVMFPGHDGCSWTWRLPATQRSLMSTFLLSSTRTATATSPWMSCGPPSCPWVRSCRTVTWSSSFVRRTRMVMVKSTWRSLSP